MRAIVALLVAIPLVGAAQEGAPPYAPAAPQQYHPPSALTPPLGYHARRHVGFFVRPELGLGWVSTKGSADGFTFEVSGNGAAFGLAVGGAVSENFILAAHVWDVLASDPEVKMSGGGFTASGTATDATSAIVGYGVLLNWYLMPSNVYLAVTPSLTRLVVEDDTSKANSEWGVGLRAAIGKEWWVSNSWGLGLAASLAFSRNKDTGVDAPTLRTTGFGLTFSATYN